VVNERGEIQGWVLIALMTLALGVAVWAVAQDQIADLVDRVL
jgi:hypothetical protein